MLRASVDTNGLILNASCANMSETVQIVFAWFQEKVISMGAEIIIIVPDGVSSDHPDATAWGYRSRIPFFRGYRGILLHRPRGLWCSFFVGCYAKGMYEAVIFSKVRYVAYTVKVDEKSSARIPIRFIVASSNVNRWIYDLKSVLNAKYDKENVLCGNRPVLSYPETPIVSEQMLYDKICEYLEKIGRFEHVYFGEERLDQYGWFKLRPDAFTPFSPPSRLDEAISVELIADGKYKFDERAAIHVSWFPSDFDMRDWTIFIDPGNDPLAREQSIDQALYTLLPKAGSQRGPVVRSQPSIVSLPEDDEEEES